MLYSYVNKIIWTQIIFERNISDCRMLNINTTILNGRDNNLNIYEDRYLEIWLAQLKFLVKYLWSNLIRLGRNKVGG